MLDKKYSNDTIALLANLLASPNSFIHEQSREIIIK